MVIAAFVFMGVTISAAYAEEKPAPPVKKIAVRAGHLIDGRNDKVIDNALILIEGDTITSVSPGGQPPAGVEVLDLSQYTVLPGFMDTHTHVILTAI
jgi:imidazolonepropionase-like amidohydrolase